MFFRIHEAVARVFRRCSSWNFTKHALIGACQGGQLKLLLMRKVLCPKAFKSGVLACMHGAAGRVVQADVSSTISVWTLSSVKSPPGCGEDSAKTSTACERVGC